MPDMPKPDYFASTQFLSRWSNQWILTAILPDTRETVTETFTEEAPCREWLESVGPTHNIYFHVNPCLRPLRKKAGRADIAALAWLHVDIDPQPGQDPKFALDMLRQPPEGLPAPTAIVFSGGGYQGFWKLSSHLQINGIEEKYEDAKRYNQFLEQAFKADNCHNVDRIMRLPGTINWPDQRKKAKGRQPALARLIEWHNERIYPLTEFKQLQPVQSKGMKGFSSNSLKVSGNLPRLASLDELPSGVTMLCKVVINNGHDPDELNRFGSRSEALFFVCCELLRNDVSVDTIFSIITDPEFGISSSVLDKEAYAEKYALRQIERAQEYAINPWLAKMNDQHAVIGNLGGKCRVIEEVYDEQLQRSRLVKQSFEDIRNRYCHIRVQVGLTRDGSPMYAQLGKWWLTHEKRRQYNSLVFSPGGDREGDYNLWRGFGVEPSLGNRHLSFLAHLRENVCQRQDALYDYLLGWLSRAVQLPGQQGHTAVVMRGDQGVGKGFVAKAIGKLFGRHFLHVANAQHLTGNFNYHLRDCVLLFADEAFYAGDKRHASVLKTLITEDSLVIEAKGLDSEMSQNCTHLIMASNDDWVVPAGMNERRFFVLDVSNEHRQDTTYFNQINKDLEDGGLSNLLHFLLEQNIKEFNVRKIPQTVALQEQKVYSFSAEEEWWFSKLREGRVLQRRDGWPVIILCEELLDDYVQYTRNFSLSSRGNATKLGRFLRKCWPSCERKQLSGSVSAELNGQKKDLERPYVYALESLDKMRSHWDLHYGGPFSWPAPPPVHTGPPAPF